MRSKRNRTGVARFVLGMLLFSQAALSLAGCDWLRAAPALAISASVGKPTCHEAPVANANLCLAHCLSADQSSDTPQLVVPTWVVSVPLVVAVAEPVLERPVLLQFVLPRPAAPPPRILYQSFLI